jgi:hypothetical protein
MSDETNVPDVKPWDLLNPNKEKSDEELKQFRMDICKGCEHFRKTNQTCRKCGCFMSLKTTLKAAKCPVDKW